MPKTSSWVAVLWLVPTIAFADPPAADRIDLLHRQLAQSPASSELRLSLSEEYLRVNDPQAALRELDVLHALRGRGAGGEVLRARALRALGRRDAAEEVLNDYVSSSGSDWRALRLRAQWREDDGRLEEALDDMNLLQEAFPQAGWISSQRGRLLERLERIDEALSAFQEAFDAGQRGSSLRRALIRCHRALGQPALALEHVDVLIAQARVASRWHLIRAVLLEALDRDADARRERALALADAQRLVHRRPSALALMERGRVFAAVGELERARDDLQTALTMAPRLEEARVLLAAIGGSR